MQLHEFYAALEKRDRTKRIGQEAFNLLHDNRKDLAERIAGTDNDPFYVMDTSHANWKNFNVFLAANW